MRTMYIMAKTYGERNSQSLIASPIEVSSDNFHNYFWMNFDGTYHAAIMLGAKFNTIKDALYWYERIETSSTNAIPRVIEIRCKDVDITEVSKAVFSDK